MRPSITPAILLVLAVGSAQADGLSAGDSSDCGGDALSSATVVEHRRPRHGPLTAMSPTLCADLAPQQPQPNITIYVDPFLRPRNGAGSDPAPYGRQPPRPGGF